MELLRFNYIDYGSLNNNQIFAYAFEDREDIYVVNGVETEDDAIKYELMKLIDKYALKSWNKVNDLSNDPEVESFDLSVKFDDGSSILCSATSNTFDNFRRFKKDLMDIFDQYQNSVYVVEESEPRLLSVACFICKDDALYSYLMITPNDDWGLNYHFLTFNSPDYTNYVGHLEELDLEFFEDLADDYDLLEKYSGETQRLLEHFDVNELFGDRFFLELYYSDHEGYIVNDDMTDPMILDISRQIIEEMEDFLEKHRNQLTFVEIQVEQED